ncbi:MAG: hypothetical protein ACHQF2_00160 [Flavobacteriales bacterium]
MVCCMLVTTTSFKNSAPVPFKAPGIFFEYNSSDFIYHSESWLHPDSVCASISKLALSNPWTFRVYVHCDSGEKNIKKLCEKRWQRIRKLLIAKGMPESSLSVDKKLDTEPIITADEIKSKPEKERQELRKKNCRASFKIVSTDKKE